MHLLMHMVSYGLVNKEWPKHIVFSQCHYLERKCKEALIEKEQISIKNSICNISLLWYNGVG